MEHERTKRRKCGPRVKTGCITCRIRRVKCDEGKPNCQRCVSTGRKCDGYITQQNPSSHRSPTRSSDGAVELVGRPSLLISNPLEANDDPRTRQLFHFYCVQSAFDLSVYLNSSFWQDMILQYSQCHSVVRQAVVAFGSSHLYALSVNQQNALSDANGNAIEPVQRYDHAIRSLREYMKTDNRPDPHVVLICCALFFSCENARGNREAAWQHLENGLHILKSFEVRKSKKLLKSDTEVTGELELVASKNGAKLKAKTDKIDIDEELIYVFSRLDVQATLCKETRQPVLNLAELFHSAIVDTLTLVTTFATITEAQRSLDYIHNRLARFLSNAAQSPVQDTTPYTPEPDWIEEERTELSRLCQNWEICMNGFIGNQQPAVLHNLQSRHAPKPSNSPEWQLALQIQLLILHHRCWWMLFRSYHNPSTFTMSPNPRAVEILDVCEFLGFALPLRPSAMYTMTEMDMAWKMISEISVIAPLFVLAMKCTAPGIRTRAIAQLVSLRQFGNGMYHEIYLDRLLTIVTQIKNYENEDDTGITDVSDATTSKLLHLTTPMSDVDFYTEFQEYEESVITTSVEEREGDLGSLLGWSSASPSN